jgi:hypothetical protein
VNWIKLAQYIIQDVYVTKYAGSNGRKFLCFSESLFVKSTIEN